MGGGIRVRDLDPSDYDRALPILNADRETRRTSSADDGELTAGGLDYYRERGSALAAEGDGAATGYLLAYVTSTRNMVWVRQILVESGYRRRGIATRLYERLKEDSRVAGVWAIVCSFAPDQIACRLLHEKLGFEIEVTPDDGRTIARARLRKSGNATWGDE